ncbi:MAG: DUF47 family protein [Clostridia bacterium]|nr:DUF47 family protein [Clostridia bacterium]
MFTKNNSNTLIMKQLKDVELCLVSFENFMRAAVVTETARETIKSLSLGVIESENVADISLRKMIDSLNGPYLPSTREDLINIATSCDKIANKCETVTKIIVYQRFSFPADFSEDVLKIVAITRKQFTVLENAIRLLFEKFGELIKNHDILDEIRALESDVDRIEEKLYEKCFDDQTDLARSMQIHNVVELLSDVSDIIEDIADKIQIMLISRKA